MGGDPPPQTMVAEQTALMVFGFTLVIMWTMMVLAVWVSR